MTSTSSSRTSLPRRLGYALRDVSALIYLAVCAGLLIWALWVSAIDQPDASVAGIFPLLATAPTSFIPMVLLPDSDAAFAVAMVIGALVNAAVIGSCARALRRGRSGHDPVP